MSQPVARYTPSRLYLSLTVVAFCGALFSGWMGLRWSPSWIASALFALSGVGVGILALRPVIEIHPSHLAIGRLTIPWLDIQSVDETGWSSPLAVFLTLRGDHRILLLYAGDRKACANLLQHIQQSSQAALLDGIPHHQFWGRVISRTPDVRLASSTKPEGLEPQSEPVHRHDQDAPARYPLLCPEDEQEVERMFQRLKSVGHLEARDSEEK